MSASSKKKLRKEQNAAELTKKQLQEQAESKKLKQNTVIFTVIIVAVVVTALVVLGTTLVKNSGIIERNTVAAVIDGEEYDTVELGYYYMDAVNQTYSEWQTDYGDSASLYAMLMGLDMSKPLDEQYYDAEKTGTWADYFIDLAIKNAGRDQVLCKLAEEAGFITDEDNKTNVDAMVDYYIYQQKTSAASYGYTDLDLYLRAFYGSGSNERSYREYAEKVVLASSYYSEYANSISISDEEIQNHSKENYDSFSSFDYVSYYVSTSSFLKGGTTDAAGNTVYSDLDIAAAQAAAKEIADQLATCTSVEELDKAIAALEINADVENAASTKNTEVFFTNTDSVIGRWMFDESRQEGDITVLPSTSTSTDEDGEETTSVDGYYVLIFQSRNDNEKGLGNVRHLLVAFESATDSTTFTDEEKAAAKKEAEKLLKQFQDGEATEESFIELVKSKTDDTASVETGGLYENITVEEGIYVEAFKDWAVDTTRKPGDVEIVETEYGYHIMYYVGDSEETQREVLIRNYLKDELLSTWYNEKVEAVESERANTSRLRTDLIMRSGSSSTDTTTPSGE